MIGDAILVGSAVIAGVGTGIFTDYKAPVQRVMQQGGEIIPNATNHEAYKDYANAYLEAIDALTDVYKHKIFN